MTEHAPGAAGKLSDDAKVVLAVARETVRTYTGTFDALRRLVLAEVGLARDALVRAMVFLMVASIMFGTTYALLTALAVSGLRAAGWSWTLALLVPAGFSLVVAMVSLWIAQRFLHHADFEATRRQFRKGFGTHDPGELSEPEPLKEHPEAADEVRRPQA